MSVSKARAPLQEAAFSIALNELEAEFTAFNEESLKDVVRAAITTLAVAGQSDPRELATYAAARGRGFIGR